jgi:hypothetical protein
MSLDHQLIAPDIFAMILDDLAWTAPLPRYRVRRALEDGLSHGEVLALRRFGDEPFSWEIN